MFTFCSKPLFEKIYYIYFVSSWSTFDFKVLTFFFRVEHNSLSSSNSKSNIDSVSLDELDSAGDCSSSGDCL